MLISGSDPVGSALYSALDGLQQRQQVAADNIANVDTPDFIARSVDFEDSLKGAISDGSIGPGAVTSTTSYSGAQRGANGNNVDLAKETMVAMQSTFRYQLLTRAVGDRFGMVTTAIGGM